MILKTEKTKLQTENMIFKTENKMLEYEQSKTSSDEKNGFIQPHIYEMAGLVLNVNFVNQRKLSAKKKHQFSKAATS
jgi:hypothetical protein